MIVYLFGMLVSIVIAQYVQQRDEQLCGNNFFAFFSVLIMACPLVLIAAIRYDVGADYWNYVLYHIPSVIYGASEKGVDYIEHGYGLIVKASMYLTNSEQMVFAVTAAIVVVLFIIYIREWSGSWSASMAIFVLCYAYNQSLNIMRQYIAIAIFFYALRFIKRKQMLRYTACIIVACFMHKIALLYLPVYFICQLDLKKKRAMLFGVSCAIILLNKPLLSIIRRILEAIAMNKAYTKLIGTGEFSVILFGINMVVFLLACFTECDDGSSEEKIMFNIQYIAFVVSMLMGTIPFGIRILYMFMPIQVVYIPFILSHVKVKEKEVVKMSVWIVYFIFYIYYVAICNYGNTLPYRTIFNKG